MAETLPRVILKFRDAVELPYVDDVGPQINQRGIGDWQRLATRFSGIRIRRLYRQANAAELKGRARNLDPNYKQNLQTLFVVECASIGQAEEVASDLRGWTQVERAYLDSVPTTAQGCSMGYTAPAASGVDVVSVGRVAGGRGEGQAIVDVELGWTLNHDALNVHAIPAPIAGVSDPSSSNHGTSVLGIVCGNDAATAFSGLAPDVFRVRVASAKPDAASLPSMAAMADAIAVAALSLSRGNVILLPMQSPSFLPCETDPACFASIYAAGASKIVVVEAAGNGNIDLDSYADPNGGNPLRRGRGPNAVPYGPSDSYAIMVASSTSTEPHARRANSNFGSRIDCYAWGDSIMTSTSIPAGDTHSFAPPCFDNTSGASAIIAGVVLIVQGVAAASGSAFEPLPLRAMLADPLNGTPPHAKDAGIIGIMPDLLKLGAALAPSTTAPSAPTNVRIIS